MVLVVAAVIALAIIAGLIFYFLNNKPVAPVATVQEKSATKTEEPAKIKEETITPLHLEYALKNFGPGNSNAISYYIENKTVCDGRDAYLGVAKFQTGGNNPQMQYAKFTIYTDNGQMAISTWVNETGMAFDDAISKYNDMNLPLMLSEIFTYAGKNLNSAEYWRTESPILLKGVYTGQSMGDYSIVPQENDNTGAVACKKFKIIVKSTNTDGYFNSCVAQKINDIDLPFTVSMAFENAQGPSWTLKSFDNEKSGIAWIPQCLLPVACKYIAAPPQSEKTACAANGGQIETNYDEQGCAAEYKCMTQTDRAAAAIKRMQNPECPVNQKVADKVLQCWKNNQPNFDPNGYDNAGCMINIANCRQ